MPKIVCEIMVYPNEVDLYCYPIGPSILASACAWYLLYKLVRYVLPKYEPEFCNRLVTLTHGCTTGFVGLNQCFMDDLFSDTQSQTSFQKLLLIYSLGYFIFDLGWCLYFQSETKLMVAHHIFSCYALLRIVYKNYSGAQSTCALGCMEITNPLLQARWFIRTFGYHQSAVFTSVEVTFMLTFLIVRIIFGTVFAMMMVLHPENNLEFKMQSIVIYVISWMFLMNMVKYFSKKYVQQEPLYLPNDDIHASDS